MNLLTSRPVMVSMLNDKGVSYIERRQYAQATKSLSRALRIAEKEGMDSLQHKSIMLVEDLEWPKVRKELSTLTLISVSSVESSDTSKTPFKHRAEYDEGMDYFKNPLKLGDNNNRSIDGTILYNLARCHHNQGNYDEALGLYKRSLRSLEKWPVCDEPLTLAILFGIGQIQYIRGDHSDSLKTYMTSLNFARAKFGSESLEVAACMNCIGVLHYIMPKGDSETALDALNTSIQLRMTLLGADHIDVGTTWNNIGRIYFQQGDYENAMSSYRRALVIRKREQGDSVDVAATICKFLSSWLLVQTPSDLHLFFVFPPQWQSTLGKCTTSKATATGRCVIIRSF
jgi:tetratricopeptide (TPR) repeat protein